MILKNNGEVYATGKNSNGQLGLGGLWHKKDFTKVNISNVKSISCSAVHCMILKNNGEVYGAGHNFFGQLGLGNNTEKIKTFTKILL